MSDSEQEKSEQATPFKLQNARKKGIVARGVDLGFLTALTLLFACVSIACTNASVTMSAAFARVFADAAFADTPAALRHVAAHAASAVSAPIITLCAILFGGVFVMEFLQTGPVFSTAPLKPDFNKLNPAKNLARLVSPQMLVQFAKTMAKACVYIALAAFVIQQEIKQALQVSRSALDVRDLLQSAFLHLLAWCLLAATVFAVLDQVLSRRLFQNKMRMSRRDLHREFKDREGDPRLKRARKKMHADFANARKSMSGLKESDILLVNPTHYAIGLRYTPQKMDAPQITCVGYDTLALRLRRLATLYAIPVVEDRLLARLLGRYEIGSAIPEAAFSRVADHYLALRTPQKADAHA